VGLVLAVAWLVRTLSAPRPQPLESGPALAAFVEAALRGGDLAATEPFVARALAVRLEEVDPATLRVEIREGEPLDGPGGPRGATHHAIVSRDGQPWILLRCRYDSDPTRRALVGVSAIE